MDRSSGGCGVGNGDDHSLRCCRTTRVAVGHCGSGPAPVYFFIALWNCLTERSFWYVFGWLIPLGIWRLKYFPTPWLVASLSTSAVAILLGAYSNAGGTVGRATFNIIGPLLSLSVALLIAQPSDHLAPVKSELNS